MGHILAPSLKTSEKSGLYSHVVRESPRITLNVFGKIVKLRCYNSLVPRFVSSNPTGPPPAIVTTSRPLADNIILDLNKKNELLGIEIIGPKPEDLKEFKPKAKIIARA
jgi:Protein of unknown function (DUF2283)